MKHIASEPTQLAGRLNAVEQQDFDLIVANAKSMGWLPCGDTLIATRDEAGILVRAVPGSSWRERRYSDRHRWLLQLLHDLAQGVWKQQPASCRSATRSTMAGSQFEV